MRALLAGLGLLPRSAAVAAGRGLGSVAYVLCRELRRTGRRNLELAFPEKSEHERTRILRSCFRNLGRLLGEFSQFRRATPESLREITVSENYEYLLEAKRRGKGIIFLTSHLGAWELLSFAYSAFGHPHTVIVRRIDNPLIERMIERIRGRFGNRLVDKKNSARAALKLLREGGALGLLADVNTLPHEGVFVPFFGHLACTTAGVATLALRTDATVIPVYAVWQESRRRFLIHGDPPLELIRTGDHERDIAINTARFASVIESHIRSYPDQWLWIHKRWRTRPDGEPDLYAS